MGAKKGSIDCHHQFGEIQLKLECDNPALAYKHMFRSEWAHRNILIYSKE